jgi:tetratricopeptide (TPR) repeat protein/DNA-binding XRE family transcriptional regulator
MTEIGEEIFSFGTWIRRRRKALDLTQAALGERVGCAEVTIRKLEAETFRPSREIAERLADCLALPPHDRVVFLQVARGERSVDHLPTPSIQTDSRRQSPVHVPIPVAHIPLDTVPGPAPLPMGSYMPLSRNPLFVGREQALRRLARAFHAGATAAIGHLEIAAAAGLGGIGKTQLACEFVHRYGQYFPGGVFWLSFADSANVPAEVAACGGTDGMNLNPTFSTLPLNEQVKLVLAAWASAIPRLLVFDNCEDEVLLEQWRPKHGGSRLLLTSRRRHWNPALGVQLLSLDVLPRTESITLLCTLRPDLPADDAILHAIAETLGDLPLALHLAGSFLAKYRHALTPAQYLERLHAPTVLDDRSLREAGLSPTKHIQHVARTFEQSYERLDPRDPTDALALTLLDHAACFAPGEPVSRWLILETLGPPQQDVEHALLAEDALTRVINLGLLEADAPGNLRMHRLIMAFVHAISWNTRAHIAVVATMLDVADRLNKTRNPHALLALQPHLRFITDLARQRQDVQAARLASALGDHLWQLGVYGEAQGYFEWALAIQERVLGPDHPDTAWSLHHLGTVLWWQGMYAEARAYLERALAIREQVLGLDHPDTAGNLSNVGVVLWRQGAYAEARAYLERALAIQERVLGLDHPDTAWSLHYLGVVLWRQGVYGRARAYLERALAIRERVLGLDHPDTAWNLSNLGGVLWRQGAYAEARAYLERALAVQEQVLGLDHPNTTWSLHYRGVVREAQGVYGEARAYLERALAIQERVLGLDHPDTAWSLHYLGVVLWRQGAYGRARAYLERALAIREQVLGLDHPNTAWNLGHIGVVLWQQGMYAEARAYLERALAVQEQVLGPDHPDTAWSLHYLGVVLWQQGMYAEARAYLERALAIQEHMLGLDHPDTAKSLRELGELLHAQGKAAIARCYLDQAFAIFVQRLGPQHPDTEQTSRILATMNATRNTVEPGG